MGSTNSMATNPDYFTGPMNGRSTSFASRLGVILTIKARLTKCFNHCWLIPGLSNDFLHNHK